MIGHSDPQFLMSMRLAKKASSKSKETTQNETMEDLIKIAEIRQIHTYFVLEEALKKQRAYIEQGQPLYLISRDRFNKRDRTIVKAYLLVHKDLIYDYVMSQESQHRFFHDVANEDFKQFKLFLDIDYFKTEELHDKAFYQKRVRDLVQILNKYYNNETKFVAQICYYPQGVSFHIICMNIVYGDVYKIKDDVVKINQLVAQESKLPKDTKVFDERIYNKNRLFRMLHNRNMGSNMQEKGEKGDSMGFFMLLDQNVVDAKLDQIVKDKLIFNMCLIGANFVGEMKILK